MARDYHEKDYDDEVYEDDYYEEHYDEEELEDDAELIRDDDAGYTNELVEEEDLIEEEEEEAEEGLEDEDEAEGSWESDKRITVSFACEECDYRWDDVIIKKKGNLEDEEEEIDAICPMCGSMNVTLI